jgi:hypothetical protein
MSISDKAPPPAPLPPRIDGVEIIKRLREIVDPPGKKGTWIKQLNDRQLAEIYQRLQMGQTAYRVVQLCQSWGIQRHSDIKSLSRSMLSFKKRALGEIQALKTGHSKRKDETAVSKTLQKKADRVGGKINALGKLSWLIGIQEERVEMLFDREKATLPFKHTDFTVRTLLDLIKEYVEISFRLGITPEVPREFDLRVQHEFGEILTKQLGAGGSKVVDALGRFLDLAKAHSEKLVLNEDGTYVLEKTHEPKSSTKK